MSTACTVTRESSLSKAEWGHFIESIPFVHYLQLTQERSLLENFQRKATGMFQELPEEHHEEELQSLQQE